MLLLLLMTSCGQSQPVPASDTSAGPLPKVLKTTAAVRPDNSLIVDVKVTLDRAGQVYVEYESRTGGSYRTARKGQAAREHVVSVLRLRPTTTYSYRVFVVDPAGRTSAGDGGTFTTGPLPEPLASLKFNVKGGPTSEIIMMDVSDKNADYLYAIDRDSQIVWYYVSPHVEAPFRGVQQKPNYNLVFCLESNSQGLREITPIGEVVYRLDASLDNGACHHDTLVDTKDDTKIMFMSYDMRAIDDSSHGGAPKTLVTGDTIRVWDQKTGKSRVLWNVWDFIPTSDRVRWKVGGWKGFIDAKAIDWTHGSSISLGPRGNVIVSFRHLNQIISVAPDWKSIEWRLGGPGSDWPFRLPTDGFYQQHSVSELPNGNILLIDNGNGRPDEEGGEYTRALELVLDKYDAVATKVWEYRHAPDLFSSRRSNVRRLENGNTVIAFDGQGRPQVTVEVNGGGEVVWEHSFTAKTTVDRYGVYPLDSLMGETRLD